MNLKKQIIAAVLSCVMALFMMSGCGSVGGNGAGDAYRIKLTGSVVVDGNGNLIPVSGKPTDANGSNTSSTSSTSTSSSSSGSANASSSGAAASSSLGQTGNGSTTSTSTSTSSTSSSSTTSSSGTSTSGATSGASGSEPSCPGILPCVQPASITTVVVPYNPIPVYTTTKTTLTIGQSIQLQSGDQINPLTADTVIEISHDVNNVKLVKLISGSAELIRGNYVQQ